RLLLEPSPDGIERLPRTLAQRPFAWMAATAVLTLALAAVAGPLWRATPPATVGPMMRLNVELGGNATVSSVVGTNLALSPDGTRLAVAYRGPDGKGRLGTRLLSEAALTPLANTEDATSPFFSPDGQWIGFLAGGNLRKIRVGGGVAATICELRGPRGVTWAGDGHIILATRSTGPLSRVSADGGTPATFT